MLPHVVVWRCTCSCCGWLRLRRPPTSSLAMLLLTCAAAAVTATGNASTMLPAAAANRFGVGLYNDTSGPDIALQLPEAAMLVGDGGTVLLYFPLHFSKTGDPGSCLGGCLPAEWHVNALRQAYALNLRPVVRVDQWSRRIRDFADRSSSSTPHQNYTRLAKVTLRWPTLAFFPVRTILLSRRIAGLPHIFPGPAAATRRPDQAPDPATE
jgi:hypothetical protein